MIKPSSPTTNHKKPIYFSLIDQIVPSSYISILLFYQNDPNNNNNRLFNTIEKRSKLLKQSLSKILVDFYPLAGRIRENELIDCNDEGVEFCEANIISNKNVTELIENPRVVDLESLLPFQGNTPRHTNIVLSVQLNHFSCGDMALGVCISHKIADGAATIEFLKAWSTKTRHFDHIIAPLNFKGASLFPPLKEFNEMIVVNPPFSGENLAMRKLIFDKKVIRGLKVQACADDSTLIQPTTNEVVTAFIWKHLPSKFSSVFQFINLRTRMAPPIRMNSFGNFVWFTKTSSLSSSSSPRFDDCLHNELRKTIAKIDNHYIQDLMFWRDESMTKLKKDVFEVYDMSENSLFFCNMTGFPVYEVNFGMGKLIWACFPSTFAKNFCLLMSTPCGHGVEVWICLLQHDMFNHSFSHLNFPIISHVRLD
ncbi:hypothetical protein RND81_04G052400 [Saponaria officinalis]|uniref:Uncharacterized protein n=1 Tax=Saponaria officinalis TaxID=3572 RepID=A0AAW1LF22_SAPOF